MVKDVKDSMKILKQEINKEENTPLQETIVKIPQKFREGILLLNIITERNKRI